MTIRLVPGAPITASNAQPSQSPNRARTARLTSVTDTAADTQPQGVGGHPHHPNGEQIDYGAGSPLPYVVFFGPTIAGLVVLALWLTGVIG